MKKISFFSDKPNKTIKRLLFFAIILFAIMSFFGGLVAHSEDFLGIFSKETWEEETPFDPPMTCFFSAIELLLLLLGRGWVSKVFGLTINLIKIKLPISILNFVWGSEGGMPSWTFSLWGRFLWGISMIISLLYFLDICHVFREKGWAFWEMHSNRIKRVILVVIIVFASIFVIIRLSYGTITEVHMSVMYAQAFRTVEYSLEKKNGVWIASYADGKDLNPIPIEKMVDDRFVIKVKRILASNHVILWNGYSGWWDSLIGYSYFSFEATFFNSLEIHAHGQLSSPRGFINAWNEMRDLYRSEFGIED